MCYFFCNGKNKVCNNWYKTLCSIIVTLSTQDNAKLLQQLKSGFQRTINWNEYQSKISSERQSQYLDFLIDSSFQGVNRLFVLLFKNEDDRQTGYYLPKVEIKGYKVMIDGKTFCWTG